MKPKTQGLQIGVVISSFLILSITTFFFLRTAQDVSTDILGGSESEKSTDKIATPVDYETRISKGDSLLKAGYNEMAASEYALAINLEQENPKAYVKLGKVYLLLNEYSKSIENFQESLELSPGNNDYMALLGKALIRNKEFQAAQEIFDGFTSETQEAKYYGALLDSYFERYDDAKNKLDKAKNLSGDISENYIDRYLNAYAEFNSQQKGQTIYLKALLAEAMIDTEEYEMAEELSLEILGVKSDYRDVWILLGYTQLKTSHYEDAEESFKQAKKLDAIKPETHYFLGTAHYFQEEYEESIKELELALLYGFEPQTEAYKKIAESQLFLEKYEDALVTYEHLVKIDYSNIDVFVRPIWIAINYVLDLDRALSLAEEAISRFPNDAMSHNLMAWVYIEKGELELAEQSLKNSFAANPNFAESHYNAGRLREKQGNIEGAKWEYKKAYELSESGDNIGSMASEKYNALIE